MSIVLLGQEAHAINKRPRITQGHVFWLVSNNCVHWCLCMLCVCVWCVVAWFVCLSDCSGKSLLNIFQNEVHRPTLERTHKKMTHVNKKQVISTKHLFSHIKMQMKLVVQVITGTFTSQQHQGFFCFSSFFPATRSDHLLLLKIQFLKIQFLKIHFKIFLQHILMLLFSLPYIHPLSPTLLYILSFSWPKA